ncbi:hypothetical protein [Vibrio paucivorans]
MTINVTVFETYFVHNSGSISDWLYANERHQIQVGVNITKQVQVDGFFEDVPLTDEEIASITIVDKNTLEVPEGWHSDSEKNEYSIGVRGAALDIPASRLETHYRYVRTNEPLTKELVARVTLSDPDGGDITYQTGDIQFNSILTLTPREPYVIDSNEMPLDVQQVYNEVPNGDDPITVDIYRWTLPDNLEMFEVSVECDNVCTTDHGIVYGVDLSAEDQDPLRQVGALEPGDTNFILSDFFRCDPNIPNDDDVIEVLNNTYSIRASVGVINGTWWTDSPSLDQCFVMLTDNFGCDSRFQIVGQENASVAEIINANTKAKGQFCRNNTCTQTHSCTLETV